MTQLKHCGDQVCIGGDASALSPGDSTMQMLDTRNVRLCFERPLKDQLHPNGLGFGQEKTRQLQAIKGSACNCRAAFHLA